MCKYRRPNNWKRGYWVCTKYNRRCRTASLFVCPERLPATLAALILCLILGAALWGK